MPYSICVMDDAIPANVPGIQFDDSNIIEGKLLKQLVDMSEVWTDSDIHSLIQSFLVDPDSWVLTAFRNPSLYLTYEQSYRYHPEIIIFDWDYPGSSEPTESLLTMLLERAFSIVYIYTGQDDAGKVKTIIEGAPFKQYAGRLFLLHKGEDDSANKLLKYLTSIKTTNFSFKFGTTLRNHAINSMEQILVDLSRITNGDMRQFIVNEGDSKDLLDFVTERFRNKLHTLELPDVPNQTPAASSLDEEVVTQTNVTDVGACEKLWAHRLYYCAPAEDKFIRRGDIIKKTDGTKYHLIISGDCDLARFWDKNKGYLHIIELIKLTHANIIRLEEKYNCNKSIETLCKGKDGRKFSSTSICNLELSGMTGFFILPFINDDGTTFNFLGYAKDINSKRLAVPEEKKSERLTLGALHGYTRICTVSEPFLTPLINEVLAQISGSGAPDYGKTTKTAIHEKSKVCMMPPSTDNGPTDSGGTR